MLYSSRWLVRLSAGADRRSLKVRTKFANQVLSPRRGIRRCERKRQESHKALTRRVRWFTGSPETYTDPSRRGLILDRPVIPKMVSSSGTHNTTCEGWSDTAHAGHNVMPVGAAGTLRFGRNHCQCTRKGPKVKEGCRDRYYVSGRGYEGTPIVVDKKQTKLGPGSVHGPVPVVRRRIAFVIRSCSESRRVPTKSTQTGHCDAGMPQRKSCDGPRVYKPGSLCRPLATTRDDCCAILSTCLATQTPSVCTPPPSPAVADSLPTYRTGRHAVFVRLIFSGDSFERMSLESSVPLNLSNQNYRRQEFPGKPSPNHRRFSRPCK